MKRAFIFPGQGSQCMGMGQAFHDTFTVAREVFQEVDDALNQKLTKLIFEGDLDELTLTENAQPALMATSMAMVRTVEREWGKPLSTLAACLAGHSLGEYTALCAAGAFSLSDTAKLLRIRGRAMQEAVPVGDGAMAAVLGLSLEACEELAKEVSTPHSLCAVANDNCPGQIVLSGHTAAIDKAITLAPEKGARRAIKLAVSAPFHCTLMAPAALKMAEALENVQIASPQVPVISNITVTTLSDPTDICESLVKQITGRVRWRETCEAFVDLGMTTVVEVGAGKVLTGMMKRVSDTVQTATINTPKDLDLFLQQMADA